MDFVLTISLVSVSLIGWKVNSEHKKIYFTFF